MSPLEPLIPIFFFLTVGGVVVLRGPLGRALADRIAGRAARSDSGSTEALERQVEEMHYRLTELEERVDFAERVLSSGREPRTLPQED